MLQFESRAIIGEKREHAAVFAFAGREPLRLTALRQLRARNRRPARHQVGRFAEAVTDEMVPQERAGVARKGLRSAPPDLQSSRFVAFV